MHYQIIIDVHSNTTLIDVIYKAGREYLIGRLIELKGNVTKIALAAGYHRTQIYRDFKAYNIPYKRFRIREDKPSSSSLKREGII